MFTIIAQPAVLVILDNGKDFYMKQKWTPRRILALIGIALILAMYIVAFIFAFMKSESAQMVFRAAIACTILVPVILYVFLMVAKVVKPQKSPLIDSIIFDVGCVLIDFPWKEHLKEQGFSDEIIGLLWNNEKFSSLWREFDLGIQSDEEIRHQFLEAFPEHRDEIARFLDCIDDCLHLYAYSLDWLAGLKYYGYKLYVVSNWSEHMYKHIEETGDIAFTSYMDGCIWSFQQHLAKPDPKIFELVRDKYNIDPKRAVFIDDMEKNTAAAASVGFNTITFKNYEDAKRKLKSVGVKW